MKVVTLDDTHLIDKALARLDSTIAEGDLAYRNKALFLLSQGRFQEGWAAYDYRLKADAQITYARFPVPRWSGESLAGKHVLVWLEQGVGDQILAAGMLPELIAMAGSVTVLCCRRLAPVLRRSFPAMSVHRVGDPVSDRVRDWAFDCQMSIADMGLAFRRSWDHFPARPYVVADPEQTRRLRAKYRRRGRRIVGVAWRSQNPGHGAAKSMELAQLAPALRDRETAYVSLQYASENTDLLIVDRDVDPLLDLEMAVAQVAAMDHVITVSTTTAHIAGGLGIPTTVMLPRGAGRLWYWHADRADSPWYPRLKLLRQTTEDQWDDVIAQVTAQELACEK